MLLSLVVFGWISAFTVPGLCCSPKEYTTKDGQCCPLCHEGTVVRRDCTQLSGTRCGPCEPGTFMNIANGLNKCFICSLCDQGHGLVIRQACTIRSDTVCDVLNGFFCKNLNKDQGCSLAEKHTRCGAGQRIKEPGTNRTDTVCENCQPGTFSLEGVNCTAWSRCSETEVELKEGTTSSDVVCGAASRQRYCSYIPVVLFSLTVGLVIKGWQTKKNSLQSAVLETAVHEAVQETVQEGVS